MSGQVSCRARKGADALDEELALRLNARLAGTDERSDSAQSLRAVLRELAWWSAGAIAAGTLALWWLT